MTIIKDFIGTWDNAVPIDFCNQLITDFNTSDSAWLNVKDEPLTRRDWSYLLNYHSPYAKTIYDWLRPCFQEYVQFYEQLKEVKLHPSEIKIQKTEPCGGYHVWHYESSAWEVSQRELTWMIYLNDVPDGEGETEFLYQKVRVKPKAGRIAIWPAGLTHVHRGNTMFTTDKYILTGWFNKVPA